MAISARRVFLSHSGQDKDFVRELYRRLTRDGVDCFFDLESIGWGENWVKALERAIDECEYIVFVLSPDFCNSEWVAVERTSSVADDPSGLKRKVRPLTLHPCQHLPTFPRFLLHVQAVDVSTGAKFEEEYPKICRELGGEVRKDTDSLSKTELPPVSSLPERYRMPYASLGDKFVGRVSAFWSLRDALFRDSTTVVQGTAVVAGTGGLGKTQLVIEYAHRFGSAYPGGVYWVDAEQGLSTLITQISDAAGIVIDTKAEEREQVAQLWRGMNSLHLPFLVILDNFPESEPLRPYQPTTGRAHTIVTSRRQDLGQPTVRLGALTPAEGAQLLNSGERRFGADAEGLAERLGGLPLALELAKSYLNFRKDLDISGLLEEMNTSGEMETLAEFASEYRDQLPSGHEVDVVQTFRMSWEITSQPAKELLRVMGELAPAPVPRKLLRKILNVSEQSDLRDVLNKAVSELVRLSLVELDRAGDPLAHRLIIAFVRNRNILDDQSSFDLCSEAILQAMQKSLEHPDAKTTHELEALVPHAEFLAATGRLSPENLVTLLNGLGANHRTMGRFTTARDAFARALASAEKSFEAGHPFIARDQSNLALVLKDLGQLAEARDLLRQALASAEKSFEAGHPSIAISQSNLALMLRTLGQLEEARDLLREALASDQKSFEAGHPSIAISQSNLALMLRTLGQLEEARDLLRQALASAEKSFEAGHPFIATSQSNLALTLRDLGQLAEARDLLREALAADEKSFEAGHPSIAIRQSNLALVLQDLGQPEEARDLLRNALASAEKSFEAGHPSIAIRQSNLALVLRTLGQLAEARDLLSEALASDEKSFEAGHPSIASSQSNLALVLQTLGQLAEARDLLRQAYSASLERYGPDHPPTRIYKSNLEALDGE